MVAGGAIGISAQAGRCGSRAADGARPVRARAGWTNAGAAASLG